MAKRVQDSEECKTHFVRGLEGPYRAFWFWLKQSGCNHAGIWDIDIDEARMRTGFFNLDLAEAERVFLPKILKLDCGEKWFILNFCEEQYKTNLLDPWRNTAHRGVVFILHKMRLLDEDFNILQQQLTVNTKPLPSTFKGTKDKDRDRDLYKDNIKLEVIEDVKPLTREEIKTDITPKGKKQKTISEGKTDFSYFWDTYDKKKGEKEKIQKKWDALSITDQDLIFKHIDLYKLEQPNKWYRKDPDTYLNNKSWLDEILTPPVVSISTKATTSKTENIINIATAAQYQEPA